MQERYDVLQDESKNMISPIRGLQEDIKLKAEQIKDLEQVYIKQYNKNEKLMFLTKNNYANLLEYHRIYLNDNFRWRRYSMMITLWRYAMHRNVEFTKKRSLND